VDWHRHARRHRDAGVRTGRRGRLRSVRRRRQVRRRWLGGTAQCRLHTRGVWLRGPHVRRSCAPVHLPRSPLRRSVHATARSAATVGLRVRAGSSPSRSWPRAPRTSSRPKASSRASRPTSTCSPPSKLYKSRSCSSSVSAARCRRCAPWRSTCRARSCSCWGRIASTTGRARGSKSS
jgi:hypothetical protein